MARQAALFEDLIGLAFRQMGQDDLAHGGAVDGRAAPDARGHADAAAGLDLVEVEHLAGIQNAQVHGFIHFENQALEVKARAVANVEPGDGDAAQFEEL